MSLKSIPKIFRILVLISSKISTISTVACHSSPWSHCPFLIIQGNIVFWHSCWWSSSLFITMLSAIVTIYINLQYCIQINLHGRNFSITQTLGLFSTSRASPRMLFGAFIVFCSLLTHPIGLMAAQHVWTMLENLVYFYSTWEVLCHISLYVCCLESPPHVALVSWTKCLNWCLSHWDFTLSPKWDFLMKLKNNNLQLWLKLESL